MTVKQVRALLEENGLLDPGGLGRNPFWLRHILDAQVFTTEAFHVLDEAVKARLRYQLSKNGSSRRAWKRVGPEDDAQVRNTIRCLSLLALRMARKGLWTYSFDAARQEIATAIKEPLRLEPLTAYDVLYLSQDALLVRFSTSDSSAGPIDFAFRHPILQNYLAAIGLSAAEAEYQESISDLCADSRRWEVLIRLNESFNSGRHARHRALIQTVLGCGHDRTALLAAALLYQLDDVMDKELFEDAVNRLSSSIASGVDERWYSAAVDLVSSSPRLLIAPLQQIAGETAIRANVTEMIAGTLRTLLPGARAERLIAELLKTWKLRELAKEALVAIGEPVLPALAEAVKHGGFYSVHALAELGHHHQISAENSIRAVEALRQRLDATRDEFEKGAIGRALGQFGEPVAIAELSALAQEKMPWVHGPAIEALSEAGAPPAVFFQLFDNPDTLLQRFPAVDALAKSGAERLPELLQGLDNSNPDVRGAVLEALEKIASPDVTPAVAKALGDPDISVVSRAIRALGTMGDPGIEPLVQFLKESSERSLLTRIAAKSLARIGQRAIPPLLAALGQDQYPVVRSAAADALGQIGDPKAFPALSKLLKTDFDNQVRYSAAIALGNLGLPRGKRVLGKAREREIFSVPITGIRSGLAKLGVDQAKRELIGQLENGRSDVSRELSEGLRFLAGSALVEVKDQRAVPGLQKLAQESEDLRKYCEHLLESLVGAEPAAAGSTLF